MGAKMNTLSTRLLLSNKGLKDLMNLKQPRMLPAFTHLETIDLSHNKITGVPALIAEDVKKSTLTIEFLTHLHLNKNRLTDVPDCLFLFGPTHGHTHAHSCPVNLEVLNLGGNEIAVLPDKLLHLYRLGTSY